MLQPGGHLLIVDFDRKDEIASDLVHNGFDQDDLKARLAAAGFADIRGDTFYHGKKNFMGMDASRFLMDAVKQPRLTGRLA